MSVYLILDEFVLVGELQETSKKVCDTVFRIVISQPYQTNCLCPDINLRGHSRIGHLVLSKACAEAYFPPISQPEGLLLSIQDVKGKEWVF
ncbi:hypothetical protein IFM89_037408 [Coptis chinensis]|uniref:Uncharacterized protein n=1 Tax=Coptis chinensis TaxID=261450 RepID=A0A835M618_9MAGN|nr:hypothetical protein IFM89_037408 [Coptis chinensis]